MRAPKAPRKTPPGLLRLELRWRSTRETVRYTAVTRPGSLEANPELHCSFGDRLAVELTPHNDHIRKPVQTVRVAPFQASVCVDVVVKGRQ